jgi:hypothetical protein
MIAAHVFNAPARAALPSFAAILSRVALLSLVALLHAAPPVVSAQAGAGVRRAGSGRVRRARTPVFADYPAREVFRGRPAPVRLRTRRDRQFRTRLREGAREGPNFAGRYTVVWWGCGTGCSQVAVVDAQTGLVRWPPVEWVDILDPETDAEWPRGFRLDSRLLILTRSHYDRDASYTAYYFLFDGRRFRLLRRAEHKRDPVDAGGPPQDDPPDPKLK